MRQYEDNTSLAVSSMAQAAGRRRCVVNALITLCLLSVAFSQISTTDLPSPKVPPKIEDPPPGRIKFRDVKDKIEIELKVSGDAKCDSWYQLIGELRWEKLTKEDGYICEEKKSKKFSLRIEGVTSSKIGTYGVRFNNSNGACYYQYQIEEDENLLGSPVIVAAIAVSGFIVLVLAIVVIVVRCRRSKARHKREEQDKDMSLKSPTCELSRTASLSSSTHQCQSQRLSSCMCRSNSCCRSARSKPPAKVPKSFSRISLQDCDALAPCDDTASCPRACAVPEGAKHLGYIKMGSRDDLESGNAPQLVKLGCSLAPPTFPKMRPRPSPRMRGHVQDECGISSLMKSRRLSRSVPSLFSHPAQVHHQTLPNRSIKSRYPQRPLLPATPFMPGVPRLLDRKDFRTDQHSSPPDQADFFPGPNSMCQDSGIDQGHAPPPWDTDDEYDDDDDRFTSVSGTEAFRRRRNSAEDVTRWRYLRRSLEITSDGLRASNNQEHPDNPCHEVFPQFQRGSHPSSGGRHSDNKYMSMSSFYKSPLSPPAMSAAPGEYRKPLPPPRDRGDGQRIYENLDGGCGSGP